MADTLRSTREAPRKPGRAPWQAPGRGGGGGGEGNGRAKSNDSTAAGSSASSRCPDPTLVFSSSAGTQGLPQDTRLLRKACASACTAPSPRAAPAGTAAVMGPRLAVLRAMDRLRGLRELGFPSSQLFSGFSPQNRVGQQRSGEKTGLAPQRISMFQKKSRGL